MLVILHHPFHGCTTLGRSTGDARMLFRNDDEFTEGCRRPLHRAVRVVHENRTATLISFTPETFVTRLLILLCPGFTVPGVN